MYLEHSGILEMQRDFALTDLIDNKVIPAANVTDKGFRITVAAFECGQQTMEQPIFVESDIIFTTQSSTYQTTICSDRSGNERGVNQSKGSGFIKRGIHQRHDLKHFDDIWLAWSFMQNFMRHPVM